MAMTPDDKKRIIDTLNAKVAGSGTGQQARCPICGQNKWDVMDQYVSIGAANVLGVITEGKYLPTAAVLCTTCGNTQFINLAAIGLGAIGTPDPKAPLVLVTTSLRPPSMPLPPPLPPPVDITPPPLARRLEGTKDGQ